MFYIDRVVSNLLGAPIKNRVVFVSIHFYSVLVTEYHLWLHSFIGFLYRLVFITYPANVENMVSS